MNQTNGYPYLLGYYDTPTNASVSSSSVPVASLIYSASGRNPFGYVLAAGEAFSRSIFPDLSLAVDNNYSNVDTPSGSYTASADIKVPNMFASGGRFPLASDLFLVATSNINSQNAAGLYGGSSAITLTANQLPPHKHQMSNLGPNSASFTSGGSISSAAFNGANPTSYTNADIYNNANTLLTAAAGTPAAVNIQNPFNTVNALIKCTNVIPSYYQTGCVNIDSTNNRFWVRIRNNSGIVSNGTQVCTLQSGSFTTSQLVNNIVSTLSTCLLASAVGQTFVLLGFSVNSQGRYVYRLTCGTQDITVEFNFTQTPGATISQAVLDKTADTLGYFTRTSITYKAGNLTNQRDYISPPKAMKIYFGSVEENTMSSANLPNITNSF